jgi:hypothetical protein
MNVHMNTAPVGVLPTNGSCGQLLVYVISCPGRLVVAAQAVQKKNALTASASSGVNVARTGNAYRSRNSSASGVLAPKRSRKCPPTEAIANARVSLTVTTLEFPSYVLVRMSCCRSAWSRA